ncbi:MAG: CBS domain-containing protein [Pseudomonadales bacterium]|nr:CBS domain-containing protein [Pseudomonadales bacterium]
MSELVHTVAPDISLAELREIFNSVNYHHLLVTDDGCLKGVISDRDVLRRSSPYLDQEVVPDFAKSLLDQKAENFMSTELITAQPDTLVDAAAIMLLEHNISCLPVVEDEHRVVGIITWKDMLKYYVYCG